MRPQSPQCEQPDASGIISYEAFRKHATFSPEVTDFALDERKCWRLLSTSGYGLSVGGLGLGDMHILFRSQARHGRLTYDGLVSICRLLHGRKGRVAEMMGAPSLEGQDPTTPRRDVSLSRLLSRKTDPRATPLLEGLGLGTLLTSTPRSPSILAHSGTTVTADRILTTPPGQAHSSLPPQQHPQGSVVPSLTLPPPSRPQSARLAGDATTRSSRGQWSGSETNTLLPAAARVSTDPIADVGPLTNLTAYMDPPVLLREQLPLPPCDIPTIATKLSGIHALYRAGEMTRVAFQLRELQKDWEAAAQEAELKAFLKRSKHQDMGDAEVPKGQIPLAGRVWLLLLHACCLMMEAQYRQARKSMQAAENLFNPNILGLDHPYHYCIHICWGLLSYYEQEYHTAIDKFQAALELAQLISRGDLDVTARRNAAACLNNIGVCQTMLNQRAEAVLSFRAAHRAVCAAAGVPEVAEAMVALKNLNKALKHSFALRSNRDRPSSAPPRHMYDGLGATAIPQDQKLTTFIKSAVLFRNPPPVTPLPAWAVKVTPEEKEAAKKAKEAAKKGKGKDKGKDGKGKEVKAKKPPAFVAMTTFGAPSYGVANVKTTKPKTKKKKKAAA